jgi:hypothetical protein
MSSAADRVMKRRMSRTGRVDEENFVQESADKDVAAPDDLSVVLGFTQMLSDGGNVDEVSRLATDHGWLNASGQLTAAGNQLARALLQQSGTRTIFRVW